jgi:hypothetical protein
MAVGENDMSSKMEWDEYAPIDMPDYSHDAPEHLYLQWEAPEEVTWCVDKIHDTDVPYVAEDRCMALVTRYKLRIIELVSALHTIENGIDANDSQLENWIQGHIDKVLNSIEEK